MARSKLQKKSKKNLLIIVAILAVVVLAIVGVWLLNRSDDSKLSNESTDQVANEINFNPPTEEEKQAAEDKKDEIVAEQNNPPAVSNTANVVITDASQYGDIVEIRAFVSNRIDSSGSCAVTLTKGTSTITRTQNATADASTTQCGTFEIPRSDFPSSGSWSVVVTYSAPDVGGQAKSTLEVT